MSAPGRGFVVELVGLAGSGKSTLSHAAARCLRAAGAQVSEPSFDLAHGSSAAGRIARKLGYAGRDALRRPRAAAAAARAALATRQASASDALSAVFNLAYVRGLLDALVRRPGIHLLDQGFYGALWSVAFRAAAPGDATRLARRLAGGLGCRPADLVVFVEIAPETARARARARGPEAGRSRLEREGGSDALDRARQALGAVREAARGARVASLSNEGPDPAAAAATLAELVAEALPSPTGAGER